MLPSCSANSSAPSTPSDSSSRPRSWCWRRTSPAPSWTASSPTLTSHAEREPADWFLCKGNSKLTLSTKLDPPSQSIVANGSDQYLCLVFSSEYYYVFPSVRPFPHFKIQYSKTKQTMLENNDRYWWDCGDHWWHMSCSELFPSRKFITLCALKVNW